MENILNVLTLIICINTLTYYFDNEMLGESVNYNDIVSDTAKTYEMWTA